MAQLASVPRKIPLARWLTAGLCVALFGWVYSHPSAATRPAQSASGQLPAAPGIRVTTRLVQVDVVVHDKKGEPVFDLSRDDFTLTDGGQPQTISVFIPPAKSEQPVVAKPLPSGTFSNRPRGPGASPASATIILFDALNTSFNDQAYAKGEIIGFLKQIQPGDSVAIYLLARDLTVLHDFTTDVSPVLSMLARLQARMSLELEAGDPRPKDEADFRSQPEGGGAEARANQRMNEFFQSARQRIADFANTRRVESTLAALEAIANHVAPLPGRKNLVWVSGSFPFSIGLEPTESGLIALYPSQERRTFASMILRTTQTLNRADLTIYPVDARGLIGAFTSQGRFDMVPGSRARETGGLASDPLAVGKLGPAGENPNEVRIDQTAKYFATMNLLADRTGGRAFYNTNDIRGSIRRAIDDSRATYVLGFYPKHDKWDGSFREIKVKVERAGVEVRYRRGYVALPDVASAKMERAAALRDAAASPLDAAGLGITARIDRAAQQASTIALALEINPSELQLREEQGNRLSGIDLLVVQRDAQGRNLDVFSHTESLSLSPQIFADAQRFGLNLNLAVPRKPDVAEVVVVVRDVFSGAVGSLHIPLPRSSSRD